ncbi:Retinoblastoma-like protein 1 [Stylosanthes scabra]|uniref:RHOMBOID-like protein n=1 Tax=Stylosanthes scabra TaxID=79078 RepID=A0ABU6QDM9_9FABA|nr:Retinoblastoma-like protein 1 [Stylosanthes scabra]
MGALDVQKVIHRKQVWRLITCVWLHGGVFHLLANMFGIIVIGIRLEQDFGFVLIGLLYVISGFGGSLVSSLFIQQNIAVGASGALFGLLGAMLSELITNWSIYDKKVHRSTVDPCDCDCYQPSNGASPTCGQFCSYWRLPFRVSSGICVLDPPPVGMG